MPVTLVNECIPYFEPGGRITGKASSAVTGKKFVNISGNRNSDGSFPVAPPSAGGLAIGVASWDAASGEFVTVITNPGDIVPVTAAGTIAAGAEVEVDSTGAVITKNTGVAVGRCLTGATSGNDAMIKLY